MKHAKGTIEVAAIGLEVPYYALLDAKQKREEVDPTDPIILQLGDAIVQIGTVVNLFEERAMMRRQRPGL